MMPIRAERLLVNRQVIIAQGADAQTATGLALLPEVLDLPTTQGVVFSAVIGWSRAAEPATTTRPTSPTGPDRVEVDDYVGQVFAEAKEHIEALGLTVTEQRVRSDKPIDQVTAQIPVPPATLPLKGRVTLRVSQGPAAPPTGPPEPDGQILVPDLEGVSFADAEGRLTALGLRAERVEVLGEQGPGIVGRQKPAADELVAAGATVKLYTTPDEPPAAKASPGGRAGGPTK
jgi:hypothetical protein